MAGNTEFASPIDPSLFAQPSLTSRLQRLVDEGTAFVPQSLTLSQFATLHAVLKHILPVHTNPAHFAARLDALLTRGPGDDLPLTARHPNPFDYKLGLDEIDTIARIRTGFAFVELTPEIQDAILSLIATRDLTTRRLNLSLWLANLQSITIPTPQ